MLPWRPQITMHQWPYAIFERVISHLYDPADVGLFLLALKGDQRFQEVHSALLTQSFDFGPEPDQRHNGITLEHYAEWKWNRRRSYSETAKIQAQLNEHTRFWQRQLVVSGFTAVLWMVFEVALAAFGIAVMLKLVRVFRELVELLVAVVYDYGVYILAVVIVFTTLTFLRGQVIV